ncbi:MAG: putative metal-binding motif-containing protein, partial [Myxococcales bacterium]|nr:putative metal-binding motif-containing protein [Myxococcales bacterium]
MRTRPSLASLFFTFGFVLACEPGSNSTGTPNTGGSPSQGGAGAGSTQGGNENNGGSTTNFMGSGGSGPGSCTSGPDDDLDGDGFTVAAGDCNDCDPNTNPGALEVAGDDGTGGGGGYVAVDEDCDGTADNVAVVSCDDSLALDSADPLDGARAIELCKQAANDQDWGVVSAQWVRADGSPATATQQVGILTTFGTNNLPRAGARLLGLSSGRARTPGQPGACGSA